MFVLNSVVVLNLVSAVFVTMLILVILLRCWPKLLDKRETIIARLLWGLSGIAFGVASLVDRAIHSDYPAGADVVFFLILILYGVITLGEADNLKHEDTKE